MSTAFAIRKRHRQAIWDLETSTLSGSLLAAALKDYPVRSAKENEKMDEEAISAPNEHCDSNNFSFSPKTKVPPLAMAATKTKEQGSDQQEDNVGYSGCGSSKSLLAANDEGDATTASAHKRSEGKVRPHKVKRRDCAREIFSMLHRVSQWKITNAGTRPPGCRTMRKIYQHMQNCKTSRNCTMKCCRNTFRRFHLHRQGIQDLEPQFQEPERAKLRQRQRGGDEGVVSDEDKPLTNAVAVLDSAFAEFSAVVHAVSLAERGQATIVTPLKEDSKEGEWNTEK